MTSIKPPTGPSTTFPPVASPAGEVSRGDGLGGQAGELSGISHSRSNIPAASAPAAQVDPAGAPGPVDMAELVRAVERGHLSMTQAVDRLVQGVVSGLPGQLTELERAELIELLSLAVQSDPTLGALRDER